MSDLSDEAGYLMRNKAFTDALDKARQQVITAAISCAEHDDRGRKDLLRAARIVDAVAGHLNALIQASKTGEDVEVSNFYELQAKQRWSAASLAAVNE